MSEETNPEKIEDAQFSEDKLKGKTTDQIAEIIKNSKSCIVFVATMTGERDKDGRMVINYEYNRKEFPYEDTRKALDQFIKMFREDGS